MGGGAASAAATGAQATGARMESVAAPLGEEWEIPPPPALLEASGFGSEVQVAGMDPKAKTHWCKEFTLKAKQAGKEVVSKKIIGCPSLSGFTGLLRIPQSSFAIYHITKVAEKIK